MNPEWLREIKARNKWCNENWDEFMNNPYDGECESALRVVQEDRDALIAYVDELLKQIDYCPCCNPNHRSGPAIPCGGSGGYGG